MRLIATIILFVLWAAINGYAQKCPTERGKVKVLSDSQAGMIHLTPVKTSIVELVKRVPPSGVALRTENHRFPAEFYTVELEAVIIGYKLESDLDFHIVIAEAGSPRVTMIAEIPSAQCAPNVELGGKWQALRDKLETYGVARAKFKRLAVPIDVTITGIVFYDHLHKQTGVAANGIELHPVQSLDFK